MDIDCRSLKTDPDVENHAKDLALELLDGQLGFPKHLTGYVKELESKPNGEDLKGQLAVSLWCKNPQDVTLTIRGNAKDANFKDVEMKVDEWRVKVSQAIADLNIGVKDGTVTNKIDAIQQELQKLPKEDQDVWVADFNRSVDRINHFAGRPVLPFAAHKNSAGDIEIVQQKFASAKP